jgi:hypothetical protein
VLRALFKHGASRAARPPVRELAHVHSTCMAATPTQYDKCSPLNRTAWSASFPGSSSTSW